VPKANVLGFCNTRRVPQPPRRTANRTDAAKRQELIAAATRLIAREGVAAASTRKVAQEAGVPTGTFHYWFASREELLAEVIQELLVQFDDAAAREALTERSSDLRSMFAKAFEVVNSDDPGRQLAMYELTAAALRSPELRELARDQYASYRETAGRFVGPWYEQHGDALRDKLGVDLQTVTRFLAMFFDGAVLAWLADPEQARAEEVFAFVSSLLTAAVSPGYSSDK
jgi:AcrR family transcriptional regulator